MSDMTKTPRQLIRAALLEAWNCDSANVRKGDLEIIGDELLADLTLHALDISESLRHRESAIATHKNMLAALLDTNAVADDFANVLDPEWFALSERIESLRDQLEVEKTHRDALTPSDATSSTGAAGTPTPASAPLRSREEVLREFAQEWCVSDDNELDEVVERFSAMLRELESPRGEAVAWAFCAECGCTEYTRTGYDDGRYCTRCGQEWFPSVDYTRAVKANLSTWHETRKDAHPPAASGVTEAEIEAVARAIYLHKYGAIGARWELVQTKDVWHDLARAALTAAREVQP